MKMREPCDRVRALLPHYADGEVSEAETELVRAHLADCRACRREAAEWAALNRVVERELTARGAVPQSEVEAAIRKVREARPAWRVAPAPVRFWRSWTPAVALAAVAVLIAVIGAELPGLKLTEAGAMIRDEAAALAVGPRELAADVPRDYHALGRSVRSWPQQALDGLAEQWDRGTAVSQAIAGRVGTAPLAACALLLLAANFAFVRGVRSSHGRLQRG
jgi:anti-sigma factor RsiW